MTKRQHQKGFTLVELAIVMVIIGLLIGGVLKGQAVLNQSRVTATTAQVTTYDTAAKAFFDTYKEFPGDMVNAPDRLPDCANCGVYAVPINTPCTTQDGAGNGVIGDCQWNMQLFQSASYAGTPTGSAGDYAHETVLFWLELSKAGLISGITKDGITNVPASFGGSLPAARVGGGFLVGYANPAGVATGTGALPPNSMGPGTVLVLTQYPAALTATASQQVLSAAMAAQMDRKMDDNMPSSGIVRSYGAAANCYTGSSPPAYLESSAKKSCGLFFSILVP
jgi:prepilin-type N-terminal cleavage/methylation domain-containing protein